MEELLLRYQIKLDQSDTRFVRYLCDFIDWNTRMFSVVGARGAGKTTLLLQHIKKLSWSNIQETEYLHWD